MKRYNDELIKRIREVREKEILSFEQLGRRYKIPPTTIRNWCKGTVGTKWDATIKNNERKRRQFKESEVSVIPPIENISVNLAKFLTALLYGCEGSKYPVHTGISFSNSDPSLIKTFLVLLTKAFPLKRERFRVHLQVHTTHDYENIREYWSTLLSIPVQSFMKPTVRTPVGGKHRNDYMGTCTLRYGDYSIQLKLMGIFEGFIGSVVRAKFR